MSRELRTRIGIYHPVVTDDAHGGSQTSWPFWGAAWASLKMLTPRESFDNGRAEISAHYKIKLRFRDDFPKRARLICGGQKLRVIAASDPDGRREYLHLICEGEWQ